MGSGAPPDSRSASTTSHPPLFPEVTWPRSRELSACCPTPPPSLRPGLVLTTSSISCTPSVPSFTGTSVRVWRRENSPRLVRILLLWRRTTKRGVDSVEGEGEEEGEEY